MCFTFDPASGKRLCAVLMWSSATSFCKLAHRCLRRASMLFVLYHTSGPNVKHKVVRMSR